MIRTPIKRKKPTTQQAGILKMIAHSRLVKTRLPDRSTPLWIIDGTQQEISHSCAQTLIRNGWVKGERDGLPMFQESQVYRALTGRN